MAAVMGAARELERVLQRFAAAAVDGDQAEARRAFADAQALMVDVRAARDEGRAWVAAEQQLMARVPEGLSDRDAQASLAGLRGRGGRR